MLFSQTTPANKAPPQTERSHEENQERAYIAASRRTDRSLEARVQSARMASEIHKRRTGKSFRISEEIVMKEEMYEEEDDDLPRSYRILGPNLQTNSADMNYRVEAYLSNKVAMSAMLARTNEEWRQNEINQRFAQMFPQHANFDSQRRAPSHSPVAQPQPQPQPQQQLPQQHPFPQAMPQQFQGMPMQPEQFAAAQQFYPQPQNHMEHARAFSTSALAQCPPQHPDYFRQDSGVGLPTSPPTFKTSPQPDSPIDLGTSRSAFTTELPPEAKMMMGGAGMNPGYEPAPGTWAGLDGSFDMSDIPPVVKTEEEQVVSPTSDSFDMSGVKWEHMMQPLDDSTWNTFINDNAWASDQ
ncbi:hypothetical protein NLG97_g5687 [Lecanicillium saksenae]|uniref:Uncharacterized protein n=1 Tax=Lecanicillium saksenae TaxID=468837 RepID=A0ACC1QUB5_9HYPO|nr:hypothetical protein NLG97_g5687 [Lecanicillium saksenae]